LRRTRVGGFGLEQARTPDELAVDPQLSYSIDEACLLTFPRRDLNADEAVAVSHGRALGATAIDGLYAATDPDGRVIALLRDQGERTTSEVVLRPATL
jgi:tRNA pseudouridine55 synthase